MCIYIYVDSNIPECKSCGIFIMSRCTAAVYFSCIAIQTITMRTAGKPLKQCWNASEAGFFFPSYSSTSCFFHTRRQKGYVDLSLLWNTEKAKKLPAVSETIVVSLPSMAVTLPGCLSASNGRNCLTANSSFSFWDDLSKALVLERWCRMSVTELVASLH